MYSRLNTILSKVFDTYSDRTALVDVTGKVLTYGELFRRVKQRQNLFPIDEPRAIGLLMDHSALMIESLLAILRSGAACVPVLPSMDYDSVKARLLKQRVDFVITTPSYSRMAAGFLQMHVADRINPKVSEAVGEDVDDNAPAMILDDVRYTHDDICQAARRFAITTSTTCSDSVLQAATVNTETFIRETFGALLSGATLVVLPETGRKDVRKALSYAEAEGVTVMTKSPRIAAVMTRWRMSAPASLRACL